MAHLIRTQAEREALARLLRAEEWQQRLHFALPGRYSQEERDEYREEYNAAVAVFLATVYEEEEGERADAVADSDP